MIDPLLPTLFNLRRHRAPQCRIAALVDVRQGARVAELERHLRAWPWATVVYAAPLDRGLTPAVFGSIATSGADLLLVVSDDETILNTARGTARLLNLPIVDSVVSQADAREFGLYQEVLHHDIELGGYNDYANCDSQSGASVLRRLSTVQSKRVFPSAVLPYLEQLRVARPGRPLDAVDIGCGSLSNLRWGALHGWLALTGVDPLLDMYAVLRERHGLSVMPHIRCEHEICAGAEDLGVYAEPGAYDFAYSSNALDHTTDPTAVIQSVVSCLRPGGLFALNVYTREGTRENWWSCHQFDMYLDEAGAFVSETRDGRVVPLLPAGCGLAIREVTANNASTTALILERVPSDEELARTA
jgi:SAM-dependent methyltransferase